MLDENKTFEPLIVAFCCNWCSYAGADLAGTSRLSYPPNVKIIKVPCSCRVDPIFVLRAFGKGADGVIVCGCHPGDCHYSTGNYFTRRRFTLMFNLMDYLGIERDRMRLEWVSAAEATKFARVMNEFTETITNLGPNRQIVDLRNLPEGYEDLEREPHREILPPATDKSRDIPSVAKIEEQMKLRATKLLADGVVDRVLAWKKGDHETMPEPAFFDHPGQIEDLVYNKYCAPNLSKYLMNAPWLGGKLFDGSTLVFLKPCDSYSFNQLIKENLVNTDKVHIIGIGCGGTVQVEELEDAGMWEKCQVCTKVSHPVGDEIIDLSDDSPRLEKDARFELVEAIEALEAPDRFAYWQSQLSKCIRCNACRNTCPVCNCKRCVFSSDKMDMASKVNANEFEEQLFHIVRAYHVAGRCSDCGECSRVCPQDIPVHLLNRKFIKDINEFYGEYQAGENIEAPEPLTSYDLNNDGQIDINKGVRT